MLIDICFYKWFQYLTSVLNMYWVTNKPWTETKCQLNHKIDSDIRVCKEGLQGVHTSAFYRFASTFLNLMSQVVDIGIENFSQ